MTVSGVPNKTRRDVLRQVADEVGHGPVGLDTFGDPDPNLTGDELRALLDAYERQRALLESAENVLRNAELDGMADRIRAELERDQ
jgi:hypothetical protein